MKNIKYKIKTQDNGQKCQALGFTISFWKVLHSACEEIKKLQYNIQKYIQY